MPSATRADADDPVTAEYDVYLTPSQAEQIYLLQYHNRPREQPYNQRHNVRPVNLRIKPLSGHLELDIKLTTNNNFNKYQALRWGDALDTAKVVQNPGATFGPAAGFAATRARGAAARGLVLKDRADREMDIENKMMEGNEESTMKVQTLGGQIVKHGDAEEAGKPLYFIGAFREDQLHLTHVDGTVQMRPQFHHIDAEEQRSRLAASRAALETETQRPQDPRALLQRNKNETEAEKGRLEDRNKKFLQVAEGEDWSMMEYVDEDDAESFDVFHKRMFVNDTKSALRLKSGMNNDDYMDAISAPRRESPTRRRKRAPRKKGDTVDLDSDEGGDTVATS
nr:dna-directed rna polymerase iii subunit rpc5 [Quercus suber]